MLSFTLGIASIAALLGFLVGVSHSPVAGVALTAIFGIVAGALALYQKSEVGDLSDSSVTEPKKIVAARKKTVDTLNFLGKVLAGFSIAFFAGLYFGVYVKLLPKDPPAAFPWQGAASPASARIAIDWLLVQQHLKSLGYSDIQIAELYKLNLPKSTSDANMRGDQLLTPELLVPQLLTPELLSLLFYKFQEKPTPAVPAVADRIFPPGVVAPNVPQPQHRLGEPG